MTSANEVAPPFLPRFLSDPPRLLLFGGKGGVGKTTCAAAAALLLARRQPRKSFRLISTDPAHSLVDSLDGAAIPENLTVLELDAKERTDAFRFTERERLHAIVAAGTFLEDGDVDRLLNLSLPGLDELAVFLEIAESLEQRGCDCIVVDTAPSGHTLRLLAMPANIHLWVGALDALLAKRRYMKRVYGRAGPEDPLERMVSDWNAALDRMESLLHDPARCQFVPVTTAEAFGVHETDGLWRELRHLGVPVSDLMVNQVVPASPQSADGGPPFNCPTCSRDRAIQNGHIVRLKEISHPARLWTIALLPDEVRGERMLSAFWEHARVSDVVVEEAVVEEGVVEQGLVEENAPPAKAVIREDPPAPGGPCARPSRFLFFSGKGGVGKTTLACVTALRMARDRPSQRILLLSTDPAHSLSCCLGIEAGPLPTAVFGNLEAMEIDAREGFGLLRRQFDLDVNDLAGPDAGASELAFERAAIGKTLELAPPGLDELMALTEMIDLQARDRYDVFIVDSSSTGHFIRLLEMPQIVEQWLETFFALLLKYKRLLRLPRFTDSLIVLSKNLKAFRKILLDPARLILAPVSIPTQMAFEETKDLLGACGRMGISAPLLLLNRLTPPGGGCPICASLERRESVMIGRFAREFPDRGLSLAYRQGEPRGVDRLLRFGDSIYPGRGMSHSA